MAVTYTSPRLRGQPGFNPSTVTGQTGCSFSQGLDAYLKIIAIPIEYSPITTKYLYNLRMVMLLCKC